VFRGGGHHRAVSDLPAYVPLVAVMRGGRTESIHSGAIAVATADGRVVASTGDAGAPPFLRSSAKPFQVIPLIESGAADRFGLTPPEIAVAVASHHAQPMHVEAASSILRKIGLGESDLMCGTHEPVNREAARALKAAGREPTPIHCNCSGKHAGMLAVCVHRGWSTRGYIDRSHPLQQEMFRVVADYTGLDAETIPFAVDGCSLPTFSVPLGTMAAGFARLFEPSGVPPGRASAAARAIEAVRAHPLMIGGDGSVDCELIAAARVPLLAKLGAEGYFGMAWLKDGKGYGAVLKIADGSMGRARDAAVLAIARRFGLLPAEALEALVARHLPPVTNNRGETVGEIRNLIEL
jgi:L-asparaginase II